VENTRVHVGGVHQLCVSRHVPLEREKLLLLNRRSHVLRTAEQLVNHERNTSYDEPEADFRKTAAMHDVAAMMILLKMSRISHDPANFDSWVDVAGYAACGHDVAPVAEE
jgi:hypothetical protein